MEERMSNEYRDLAWSLNIGRKQGQSLDIWKRTSASGMGSEYLWRESAARIVRAARLSHGQLVAKMVSLGGEQYRLIMGRERWHRG